MDKIRFDATLEDAISQAKNDPEAAAKVLGLAMPYLVDLEQRGELPTGLAACLANRLHTETAEIVQARYTETAGIAQATTIVQQMLDDKKTQLEIYNALLPLKKSGVNMKKVLELVNIAFLMSGEIEKAEYGYENAASVLKKAVGYLRRREQMPYPLADYLADAFHVACKESDAKQCRKQLAEWLNLMPKGASFVERKPLGDAVSMKVFFEKKSPTAAAKEVAKESGASKRTCDDAYEVNEIRRYFERMESIREEAEKLADTLMQQGMTENAASNQAILTTAEKYGMNPKAIHYEYPLP